MMASHSRVPALDQVPGNTGEVRARRHRVLEVIARSEEGDMTAAEIAKVIDLSVSTVRNDLTALEGAGLACDIPGSAPKLYILLQSDEEAPAPEPPPPAPAIELRLREPDPPAPPPPAPPRPLRPPVGSLRGHQYSNKGRRRMRRWQAVFRHHVRPMLRRVWHSSERPTEDQLTQIIDKTGLPKLVILAGLDEIAERAEAQKTSSTPSPRKLAKKARRTRGWDDSGSGRSHGGDSWRDSRRGGGGGWGGSW